MPDMNGRIFSIIQKGINASPIVTKTRKEARVKKSLDEEIKHQTKSPRKRKKKGKWSGKRKKKKKQHKRSASSDSDLDFDGSSSDDSNYYISEDVFRNNGSVFSIKEHYNLVTRFDGPHYPEVPDNNEEVDMADEISYDE